MAHKYSVKKALAELGKISCVDLEDNFVAIGSYINSDRFCEHSVLIICYNKELKQFHYTGKEVELKNIDERQEIYYKKLDIIHEDEVVAFLGFCEELIQIGVHPTYGFVFNNSFYNPSDKSNFLINAKHDITTCSGFCIKVIRGFLYNNPEYLFLQDWNYNSYLTSPNNLRSYMNYILENYAKQNNTSLSQLFNLEEIKRITPLELLISAYYNELPIRKVSIDFLINEIASRITAA